MSKTNKFDEIVGNIIFANFYKPRYTVFEYLLIGVVLIIEFNGHFWIGIILLLLGMGGSTFFRGWVDHHLRHDR